MVDAGSGNLASVERAFRRAAAEAGLGAEILVTERAEEVAGADRVVLPGQGAFARCRQGLDRLPGMEDALREAAERRAVPFLGVCVGMQLMADRGLEHGVTQGLGWVQGEIAPMDPREGGVALPLPQMGWNGLDLAAPDHPLLAGVEAGEHAYFVHSYALRGGLPAELLASAVYGGTVAAMVGRDNLAGTQFHVEKSGALGLRMLGNFLRWRP